MAIRQYSTYFSCLHDEPTEYGRLGRGSHYSVMRSVEWLDVCRIPLSKPQVHDFAVIWDEDHDERVIEAVERIYMAGLLSPIQFIGERKGMLTVMVAARFRFAVSEADFKTYTNAIQEICKSVDGDYWSVDVGMFDRSPCWPPHQTDIQGLISDNEYRVVTYLRTIDILWNLGTREYVRPAPSQWTPPPIPVPVSAS